MQGAANVSVFDVQFSKRQNINNRWYNSTQYGHLCFGEFFFHLHLFHRECIHRLVSKFIHIPFVVVDFEDNIHLFNAFAYVRRMNDEPFRQIYAAYRKLFTQSNTVLDKLFLQEEVDIILLCINTDTYELDSLIAYALNLSVLKN